MTLDKDQLYGLFHRSAESRSRLHDMATRKALDLPMDDEVNVTTNTTHNGPSLWGLAGVMAATLLTGAAVGAGAFLFSRSPIESRPRAGDVRDFEVRFYDQHGRPIDVPVKSKAKSGKLKAES